MVSVLLHLVHRSVKPFLKAKRVAQAFILAALAVSHFITTWMVSTSFFESFG